MPERSPRDQTLHRLFRWSLLLKAAHGGFETIAGIVFFFISPSTVDQWVRALTRHELLEDPRDVVANYLSRAARHFSVGTQLFISAYLLIHGVVKIFLVVEVLRQKRWAYPASIAVLIAFIVYQLYRFSFDRSIEMAVLTLFDGLVLALLWREYRHLKPAQH